MHVTSDLGKQLPVYVRSLVACRIRHAQLIDLPQQHLGEALIDLRQPFVQGGGDAECHLGACVLLQGAFQRGHSGSLPTAQGESMSPGGGLPLAEHLPDKCRQLRGIGLIQYNGTWIQQHQVYRHFMLLQKRQNGILSNLQCLALRIAVCTGGDQRKGNAPDPCFRARVSAFR